MAFLVLARSSWMTDFLERGQAEDFIFVTNNQAGDGADAEKPLDPRWEKLKALKSKMENRS